ncbi:hypothetical protein [Thermosulfurimonas sp. F29]|uniref:hypothetical protein n=1 Tax=Thermosulfurimonas sp. F29 TaxID=2867247 RepID=UPI001C829F56|nr:hypothetical protein [Thermosulfurimonas sp. F29]MBX6424145.1 hypothetical protein [Thermosulfurimonas sp. F29]
MKEQIQTQLRALEQARNTYRKALHSTFESLLRFWAEASANAGFSDEQWIEFWAEVSDWEVEEDKHGILLPLPEAVDTEVYRDDEWAQVGYSRWFLRPGKTELWEEVSTGSRLVPITFGKRKFEDLTLKDVEVVIPQMAKVLKALIEH